ncbi:MAG TPA: hypothetical protein VNQ80_01220 [Parapedobacter sp.]|uniref:hypothetical protein n=1 Tax=Parapedobacter sp. TaxID=1958893 RepID=UPI002B576EC3|nr:hypothetical protein [Parapedobacter sp.]HWK55923.1 hypothetical protein [Parapedobacter sp.]
MRNFTMLAILVAVFSIGNVFGQSTTTRVPPKGSLTSGTIDSQFVYLYAISRTENGIEYVRRPNLEQIRKNVADTIRALTQEIAGLKAKEGNRQTAVEAMTDSLTLVQEELQTAQREKDSFSFIGISLKKSTYSLIMWGIVLLLAATLAIFIYRFNQSHVVTRDTKKAIADLQDEFDQHRKKAMEKEQKLKRQLQDEINKRL